jgi:hypothetical protein
MLPITPCWTAAWSASRAGSRRAGGRCDALAMLVGNARATGRRPPAFRRAAQGDDHRVGDACDAVAARFARTWPTFRRQVSFRLALPDRRCGARGAPRGAAPCQLRRRSYRRHCRHERSKSAPYSQLCLRCPLHLSNECAEKPPPHPTEILRQRRVCCEQMKSPVSLAHQLHPRM